MSKSREARPQRRALTITAEGHRGIIAVRNAPTGKQALLDYFKETLAPKGYHSPKTTGNVLSVLDKGGQPHQYKAV